MINLKIARIKSGLNQQDLADAIGVAKITYGSYERGLRKPPIDKLVKIADALHVTTDFLLEREEK